MGFFNRWTIKKDKQIPPKKEARVKDVKKDEVKKEDLVLENGRQEDNQRIGRTAKEIKNKEAYKVLFRPLVTEKSTYLQAEGTYCFVVIPTANKNEVKRAVESVFGVKVVRVRIINSQGKKVRYGRMSGQRKNTKKAYVTLAKGQSIEIHKNV